MPSDMDTDKWEGDEDEEEIQLGSGEEDESEWETDNGAQPPRPAALQPLHAALACTRAPARRGALCERRSAQRGQRPGGALLSPWPSSSSAAAPHPHPPPGA
jgi:hypothetical protein